MSRTEPPGLRIGIVIVGLRSDGGAEALVHTLLRELAATPHEVVVVTLKDVRSADRAAAEASGARVVEAPAGFLWSPRRFVRLLRALRGVDVIHTHLVGANILGTLAAVILRIPSVTTLHNARTRGDGHWYHGRLEGVLLRRRSVRLLAVGTDTAVARRPLLGDRPVHVLDNAVAAADPLTVERRAALRADVMTDPDAALVLTVGRLEPQKAQHELIDAVGRLHADGRRIELVIAGRGRREQALRALVADAALDDVVHLAGSRRDARDLMAAADVFALSSHWEGLPVALLEAMVAGTPVVVTDVGDVGQVVDNRTGIVVEAHDPGALADAIATTLDDPDAAATCAAAGAAKVAADYGAGHWADTTVEHYRAAIDRRDEAQTATASSGSDQTT